MDNRKTKEQKQEKNNQAGNLSSQLWAMANDLRGKMDASEFRDYILGFIFYRYLSDRQEHYLESSGTVDVEEGESLNDAYTRCSKREGIELYREDLSNELGYAIDPADTWQSLLDKIQNQRIRPEDFQNIFDHFKKNALLNPNSEKDFRDVFDDINLSNSSLGTSTAARAKALAAIVEKINEVDFLDEGGRDILGDVYEYLIEKFAGSSGKKAGEFYTPHEVSKVLAKLVTYAATDASDESKDVINNEDSTFTIYDPTMGSGSLLLTVQKELTGLDHRSRVHFYGQELNRTTFNLARMNLLMHGVGYQSMFLRNADTLESDWPDGVDAQGINHPLFFDAVVANPPYSQKWDNNATKMKDPRFKEYGKLAPKSAADFAFVEHCLYHMKLTGRMAIVLPHGVLFRGGAEGIIRKALLEKNYLDAVIGLPSNLFYSTGIATVVLVFRKDKTTDNVLFIDASQHFEKRKNQNTLRDEDINLIFQTYKDRKDVDKLAHVASRDEIIHNEYNLNIPRYVDTFEEEEPIDLNEVNQQIADVDKEIERLQTQFESMVADLVETSIDDDKNEAKND